MDGEDAKVKKEQAQDKDLTASPTRGRTQDRNILEPQLPRPISRPRPPPADFLLPSPYAAAPAPHHLQYGHPQSHHLTTQQIGYAEGGPPSDRPLPPFDDPAYGQQLYPGFDPHHQSHALRPSPNGEAPFFADGYRPGIPHHHHYSTSAPGYTGGAYGQPGSYDPFYIPPGYPVSGVIDGYVKIEQDRPHLMDGMMPSEAGARAVSGKRDPPTTTTVVVNGEDKKGEAIDELQRKLHFYQVMLWLKRSYRLGGETSLTKRCVYQDYSHMCVVVGMPCLFSPSVFGKVIKRTFPDLQYRRRRINRRINAHYEGLERVEEYFDESGKPLPLSESLKREQREEAERLRLQFQDKKIGGRQQQKSDASKTRKRTKKEASEVTPPKNAVKNEKRRRVSEDEDPDYNPDGSSSSSPSGQHDHNASGPEDGRTTEAEQFWRDWTFPGMPDPSVGGASSASLPSMATSSAGEYDTAVEPSWLYPGESNTSTWSSIPPHGHHHSLPSLPPPSFSLPPTHAASLSSLTYSTSSTATMIATHPCPCPSCLNQRPYHHAYSGSGY